MDKNYPLQNINALYKTKKCIIVIGVGRWNLLLIQNPLIWYLNPKQKEQPNYRTGIY